MADPKPLTDEVAVKPGDILAGKYQVERVLGAGGMGVVVAANHIVLQSRVALKFLLPEVAKHEQTAERFLREAQAAVRIKSPHVARVIDVGQMEDTGSPYMVMEFLEGKDIGEVLDTGGALDVERACLFALQTCEALATAHATGIVHRDIKPANLFLTQAPDGSPMIKVLDFGISKNTADMGISSLTKTQVSMGSPLYMSPEQMRSARDVDARADIWSLGVVLFEMLTGSLPFVAETMPQLCALVLEDAPPRVDQLRPDVPEGLADVVGKCLAKNRDQRFASVAELAQALADFVPYWGNQSAERTSRIVMGAGLGKTSAVPPVPAAGRMTPLPGSGTLDPQAGETGSPLRRTKTAFGRTGGERESTVSPMPRASRRPWLVVGAAALLAGGIGVVFYLSQDKDAKPSSTIQPAATEVAAERAPGEGASKAPAIPSVAPEKAAERAAGASAEQAPSLAQKDAAGGVPSEPASALGAAAGGEKAQRAPAPVKRKPVVKPTEQPKKPSDPFGERF